RSCHSFDCSAPHPDLHSFPTRRSSDLLLEVMRHGILCQERRLDLNLGADPFTLRMRCVSRVVASLPTPQASAERRTFNLVELPEVTPHFIADSAGNVDLQFYNRHEVPPQKQRR